MLLQSEINQWRVLNMMVSDVSPNTAREEFHHSSVHSQSSFQSSSGPTVTPKERRLGAQGGSLTVWMERPFTMVRVIKQCKWQSFKVAWQSRFSWNRFLPAQGWPAAQAPGHGSGRCRAPLEPWGSSLCRRPELGWSPRGPCLQGWRARPPRQVLTPHLWIMFLNFSPSTVLLCKLYWLLNKVPLTPKVGPWEGCRRQAKELMFRCAVRACTSPMVTVLFPSPSGVGVILIWEKKKVNLILFPWQSMQNKFKVPEPNHRILGENILFQNLHITSIFLDHYGLPVSHRPCLS